MRGSDLPHGVTKDLTPSPWTRNPKRQGSGHVCFGWKLKAAQGREDEEGPGASATGGFRGAVQRFGVESSGWGRHREIRKSARDSSHCMLDILPVISTIPDSMLSRNCTSTCYNISESTIPAKPSPKSTKAQQRRNPTNQKKDLNNPAVSPSKTAKIQSPDENSPKS